MNNYSLTIYHKYMYIIIYIYNTHTLLITIAYTNRQPPAVGCALGDDQSDLAEVRHKARYPKNGWFVMESAMKMDENWGYPNFTHFTIGSEMVLIGVSGCDWRMNCETTHDCFTLHQYQGFKMDTSSWGYRAKLDTSKKIWIHNSFETTSWLLNFQVECTKNIHKHHDDVLSQTQ